MQLCLLASLFFILRVPRRPADHGAYSLSWHVDYLHFYHQEPFLRFLVAAIEAGYFLSESIWTNVSMRFPLDVGGAVSTRHKTVTITSIQVSKKAAAAGTAARAVAKSSGTVMVAGPA